MTYHEITVVDLKMHPTPLYLLQTGEFVCVFNNILPGGDSGGQKKTKST